MTHGQTAEHAAPAKRKDGRGIHLAYTRRVVATHQWKPTRRGPYGRALDVLFPWPVATYPGKIKGALALLNGRGRQPTLKHWLRGTRNAPTWARALLAAAIERRIAELQHALALIKKEAGD